MHALTMRDCHFIASLQVRRQMGERQAAHDDRNLARMLTPAERRDKKLRKLFDNTPGGALTTRTAVYRVEDLSHGQHRFKVDVNARENHMSGAFDTV
jgi:U4/U6 small nuclear ribonucleoprotein PRP3